jgi:hypothetical protein
LNRGLDVLKVILDNCRKNAFLAATENRNPFLRSSRPCPHGPTIPQLQQQKQELVSQQIITSILGLKKVKWRLKSFRS